MRSPVVTVVRRADDSLSTSELVDALSRDGGQRDLEVSLVEWSRGRLVMVDRSRPSEGSTILLDRLDGAFSEKSLNLRAALASSDQNLHVDLQRTPNLHGTVRLEAADLAQLRGLLPPGASATLESGRAGADGALAMDERGAVVFRGGAKVDELVLRGAKANVKAKVTATYSPSAGALSAELDAFELDGPGMRLRGSASFDTQRERATFDLSGERLDLDALLEAGSSSPAERDGFAAKDAVRVEGRLRVAQVARGPLRFENLDARAKLHQGVLETDETVAEFSSGKVDLSGSRVDLRPAVPAWELAATLDGTDLGRALEELAKIRPVVGKLSGQLSLRGSGTDWDQLRSQVTGRGAMTLQGAALNVDLSKHTPGMLTKVLPSSPVGWKLGDLRTTFDVRDGWLNFTRPLTIPTAAGSLRLQGRVAFDERLQLLGSMDVTPSLLGSLLGRTGLPRVSVPVVISGTLTKPHLELAARAPSPVGGGPAERLPTLPGLPALPR